MSCVWCKGRELNDHDCKNFEHFTEEDMGDKIERTSEAQRDFDARLGGPMRVSSGMTTPITSAATPSRFSPGDPMHDDDPAPAKNGAAMDPKPPKPVAYVNDEPVRDMDDFAAAMEKVDDAPVAQTCNTEHPEACEACD